MTKQITLEEALKLVSFHHITCCGWTVLDVDGDIDGAVNGHIFGDVNGGINGDVNGTIRGSVDGHIFGDVKGCISGDIYGDIKGTVDGTINGRSWKFVETPKDKLQRLITESGNQELIDTFNTFTSTPKDAVTAAMGEVSF